MINEWTAISGELTLKDIELTYNLHVQQYFMKPQTGHAINKKGCLIPDENKERRAGGECNREDRKEKALRVKKKKKWKDIEVNIKRVDREKCRTECMK